MYCPRCGVQNSDGVTHCVNCGQVLTVPVGAQAQAPVQPKTSGLAVTAFILGLLCLTCVLWPLLVLPAIICAIIALVQISKSNGLLKGTCLAVVGLTIPLVLTLILPFIIAILMPALSRARESATTAVCATNMRQLATAAIVQRDNNQLPEQWCDFLIQKGVVTASTFVCPEAKETDFGYAINKNFLSASPQHLDPQTVAFFEADLGKNAAGGPADVVLRHRRGGQPACNIVFADGHTELVTEDCLADLKWSSD